MIVGVGDTHTVIWYLSTSKRLPSTAKHFIDTAAANGDQIAIASITLVEIVYLIEKGKIPVESLSALAAALARAESAFVEIPLDLRIARALSQVDVSAVPDMPDRIIAATALDLKVPLISRDAKIRASNISTIW
jgi:PIN domain nuclease of toxin-antitoxin system